MPYFGGFAAARAARAASRRMRYPKQLMRTLARAFADQLLATLP
jgi:hypothetical protein